jgi:hypothetical protein
MDIDYEKGLKRTRKINSIIIFFWLLYVIFFTLIVFDFIEVSRDVKAVAHILWFVSFFANFMNNKQESLYKDAKAASIKLDEKDVRIE